MLMSPHIRLRDVVKGPSKRHDHLGDDASSQHAEHRLTEDKTSHQPLCLISS